VKQYEKSANVEVNGGHNRFLPMRIVIAPDSYKESLTALEVATAIEAGFREVFPDADYLKLPLADGGRRAR